MTIEKRIEKLEQQARPNKEPTFIFLRHVAGVGELLPRELTDEESQRLMQEAREKNPGRDIYVIDYPDELMGEWERSLEEWRKEKQDDTI